MTIISIQFDYFGNRYNILSKVLEYSIQKNYPEANLKMIRIPAPKTKRKKSFIANTVKMEIWLDELLKADDNITFLDCDMLVLRDFSDAFNFEFDIGLTINGTGQIPYNGGVVFVKNTVAAKDFISLWNDVNKYLFNNPEKHDLWRNKKKYAGMNQAALGCLLETKKYKAKVKKFPCSIWNLCRNNWSKISDESRILHVKSTLRKAVFGTLSRIYSGYTTYKDAISIWHQYANEAGISIPSYPNIRSDPEPNNKRPHRLKRRRIWFEKTLGRPYK